MDPFLNSSQIGVPQNGTDHVPSAVNSHSQGYFVSMNHNTSAIPGSINHHSSETAGTSYPRITNPYDYQAREPPYPNYSTQGNYGPNNPYNGPQIPAPTNHNTEVLPGSAIPDTGLPYPSQSIQGIAEHNNFNTADAYRNKAYSNNIGPEKICPTCQQVITTQPRREGADAVQEGEVSCCSYILKTLK